MYFCPRKTPSPVIVTVAVAAGGGAAASHSCCFPFASSWRRMQSGRQRSCNPLGRTETSEELSGTTLLPPPEHSFWRQSPRELAAQAHLTLKELELARISAIEQAKHAVEVRS